MQINDWIVK